MIQDDVSTIVRPYWDVRTRVPGALEDIDFLLFDHLLREQETRGDLLEIGAFLGKSAVLLGLHARPDETVVINDIFDSASGTDGANVSENEASYSGLTRERFLTNYRGHVARDPRIVQELSSGITDHVATGSLRFAHVDGGHLFQEVQQDLDSVRTLLGEGGLVAFDDIRAVHTPGVAAVVWGSVSRGELIPFCVSSSKFYGAFDVTTAAAAYDALHTWAGRHDDVDTGTQLIADHEVLLVQNPQIWTPRRLARALVPPAIIDRVRPRPAPHLGS